MSDLSTHFRKWRRFLSRGAMFRELANAGILALTLSAQLRAMRRKHGWSRREVAHRMGVHWLTVARYECALISMKLSMLLRFASVYDVALIGRFDTWWHFIEQTPYSPLDVMRWRRGLRSEIAIDAPANWSEENSNSAEPRAGAQARTKQGPLAPSASAAPSPISRRP